VSNLLASVMIERKPSKSRGICPAIICNAGAGISRAVLRCKYCDLAWYEKAPDLSAGG
jgi:hypothetical protein